MKCMCYQPLPVFNSALETIAVLTVCAFQFSKITSFPKEKEVGNHCHVTAVGGICPLVLKKINYFKLQMHSYFGTVLKNVIISR